MLSPNSIEYLKQILNDRYNGMKFPESIWEEPQLIVLYKELGFDDLLEEIQLTK